MITTRRQIMSEKDRYGGYNAQPVAAKLVIDEPVIGRETEVSQPQNAFEYSRVKEARQEIPAEAPVIYSPRRYPNTAEYIGTVSAPVRERRPAVKDAEAIMPSIKTRSMRADVQEQAPQKREKSQTNLKTKLVLAAYAMVVVVLAAVVIGTGLAIAGASESVAGLQSELSAKNAIILGQNTELEDLSNITEEKASEHDMVKVGDTVKVESSASYVSPDYASRTNWFDKFCDWLSGIIGG